MGPPFSPGAGGVGPFVLSRHALPAAPGSFVRVPRLGADPPRLRGTGADSTVPLAAGCERFAVSRTIGADRSAWGALLPCSHPVDRIPQPRVSPLRPGRPGDCVNTPGHGVRTLEAGRPTNDVRPQRDGTRQTARSLLRAVPLGRRQSPGAALGRAQPGNPHERPWSRRQAMPGWDDRSNQHDLGENQEPVPTPRRREN